MQINKLVITLLCIIDSFCVLAVDKYNLFRDERVSRDLKDHINEKNKIDLCKEGRNDKLNWYRCLRSDETLQSIDFRTDEYGDAGPVLLFIEWGDYLCASTTQTVQCYQQYLRDLVNNCLGNHSTTINESNLEALESMLSVVCSEHGMNPKAKEIFKCTEDNFDTYCSCYANTSGMYTDNLKSNLGVLPYMYEYVCRLSGLTEDCVRKITIENCQIPDDGIISQLFRAIRNTNTCKNPLSTSAKSFNERVFQKAELRLCYDLIIDARTFDSECLETHYRTIWNDFISENSSLNFQIQHENICAKVPDIIVCGNKWGDRKSACIFSDFKHFGKQGFRPLYELLRYFCADYEANIAEIVKPDNKKCMMDRKEKILECIETYVDHLYEMNLIAIIDVFYIDYEHYDDLVELKECLVVKLEDCSNVLIKTFTNAVQVVLDELNRNKFIYDSN